MLELIFSKMTSLAIKETSTADLINIHSLLLLNSGFLSDNISILNFNDINRHINQKVKAARFIGTNVVCQGKMNFVHELDNRFCT